MADPYDFRISIPAGKMYRSEGAFELEEGDIVNVSAMCRGDDLSYQVGIIGTGGEVAAIEGSRTVENDFEISRDGTYHICLGNTGKESIDVMVVAETIP